jgi:hypothetical protein
MIVASDYKHLQLSDSELYVYHFFSFLQKIGLWIIS